MKRNSFNWHKSQSLFKLLQSQLINKLHHFVYKIFFFGLIKVHLQTSSKRDLIMFFCVEFLVKLHRQQEEETRDEIMQFFYIFIFANTTYLNLCKDRFESMQILYNKNYSRTTFGLAYCVDKINDLSLKKKIGKGWSFALMPFEGNLIKGMAQLIPTNKTVTSQRQDQGNLIQGKAQVALKNWKTCFGDQREDSRTSLEVCYLL